MAGKSYSRFALKAFKHGRLKAASGLEFTGDYLDAANPALPDSTAKRNGQFCIDAKLKQSLGFGFGRLISRQDTDAWHCRRPA